MKNTLLTLLVLALILSPFAAKMGLANELTADEIIAQVDLTMGSDSKIMTQEMTLVSASGARRTREIRLQNRRTEDQDFMLVRFLAPTDVRGTGLLMTNDDTWLYLPALGRSRRIAGHAKKGDFMGSDLSFDDMEQLGMTGFGSKFAPTLLRSEVLQGTDTYVLELAPLDSDSDYSKLVMWVDQARFLPRTIEYVDTNGKPLKVLHNDGIQEVDGRWVASVMEMENVQQGTKTILKVSDVEFDVDISDSNFTVRSLERGL
ncbi:MAG TPA: outer membrane lipoprotein-sorting protein [Firmicutes bacterium]|jgi:outer membrane lipoprotein-sorting protein|nr:outer membrane lipoprotein-sorting protein [Bacillota bacterium]